MKDMDWKLLDEILEGLNEKEYKDWTEKEKVLWYLAHLNGQVCNGGFSQWVDNGYAVDGGYYETILALNVLGTPTAQTVLEMLTQLEEYLKLDVPDRGFLGDYWKTEKVSSGHGFHFSGDNEDEDEEEEENPGFELARSFDSPYYELGDNILLEEAWAFFHGKELKRATQEVSIPQKKIKVKLLGDDGNAFLILGKVSRALKRAGRKEEAKAFVEEATQGDYNHLLRTAMKYVEVD